ncbi:hypothetical protein D1164_20025 [Mariniphaga sediminis]|jgi:hypothetical protein|uniref:Uncharacterized protein n=1 Tax=Mariniphaga sediminis TaxID=1628158 RepID=A0A399CWQ9_9BACT|nr:hypothetical protein D1164_20025 [Mariniphaga sediminis]
MGIPLYENKKFKMTNTYKMKISWKNDLQQSIVETDVQSLRNQLKIIQSSSELNRNMRLQNNTEVRENNL